MKNNQIKLYNSNNVNSSEIKNDIRVLVEDLFEDGMDYEEIKRELVKYIDLAIEDIKLDLDDFDDGDEKMIMNDDFEEGEAR